MVRVAVLDANVLWPQYLRDALLSAAAFDLYRGHWTESILREMRDSRVSKGNMSAERADSTLTVMRETFPHFMITGYEPLIPLMTNDEKDRHVLAAAVHAGADTIVTFNTRDFSPASRAPYCIGVDTPDEFLTDLWIGNTSRMARALVQMANRLKKPPYTVQQLIGDRLRKPAPTFARLALASGDLERAVRDEHDGVPIPPFRIL